jgi:lipid-binding SYLF domain-containing protein
MTRTVLTTLALCLSLCFGALARADDKYAGALDAFQRAGETDRFFQTAYGYALFPTIGKGGIGLGGAHGKGRVYAQGEYVGDASMTQITVGLQLGGQAYSQIIFLEDRRAFEMFTSGNFEFSAQATAVAITAGVSAEASTGGGTSAGASGGQHNASAVHGGYRKGMAIFTIAKGGLMYEATLGGQKFKYTPLGE